MKAIVRYLGLLVLALTLLMGSASEAPAQNFFSRLIKKGAYLLPSKSKKHKRLKCGYMDAYNKKRSYRKYRRGRSKDSDSAPTTYVRKKRLSRSEILARRTGSEPDSPASNTPNASATASSSSSIPSRSNQPAPPGNSSSSPPGGTSTPTLLATNKPTDKPSRLTQEALKNMTEQQRRDTLANTPPSKVLPPIQFISDQDEFSVVNMDSFMKAMEYAQEGKVVLIEGHTDDLGRAQYNLDLSMKRSEKIRQLLLSAGVADELISVIGYGESQPKVPNTSDENRAINRRIEFKIFDLSQ